MQPELLAHAEELSTKLIDLRRRIHQRPERGLDLPQTQALVIQALEELGVPYRLGEGLSSVIGVIEGEVAGPDIILRADMDALPLEEATGLSFASEHVGVMHACGHDTHVAMLLGAAELLMNRRRDLAGRVVLMFQPGEEGFAGARHMLEEGLLDGIDTASARALAVHITTRYRAGEVHFRAGPTMVASDYFEIIVRGRGGHAAEPYLSLDPIPSAAQLVLAIQTMVTRRVNVFDPAIVTITRLQAGSASNIIPDEVRLGGTIRTISEDTRAQVHDLLRSTVAMTAAAHGCEAETVIDPGYPVTLNDHGVTDVVERLATDLFGEEWVHRMPAPRPGGEDFSYVLQQVPGAMVFLGGRPPSVDLATAPMNHSSEVVFDESVFSRGAALHAAFALASGR